MHAFLMNFYYQIKSINLGIHACIRCCRCVLATKSRTMQTNVYKLWIFSFYFVAVCRWLLFFLLFLYEIVWSQFVRKFIENSLITVYSTTLTAFGTYVYIYICSKCYNKKKMSRLCLLSLNFPAINTENYLNLMQKIFNIFKQSRHVCEFIKNSVDKIQSNNKIITIK